jgi:hypothetical protein
MMIKKTVGDWLFIIVVVVVAGLFSSAAHAEWAVRGGASFNNIPTEPLDTWASADVMLTYRQPQMGTELNVGVRHVSTTEDTRVNWNGFFIELRADLLRF